MGSFCLSSASILRCESLTRIQAQVLIIPTAIEVIFSTSLIFTNWGSGRRHLLLTVEGWIYFALALLELLSHIIPAARDNMMVFKNIDIILAATSFLPILFYTVFLYLFSRADLTNTLPQRFQRLSSFTLLIFIPPIIGFNEVASFIGITYRVIVDGSTNILAIGFNGEKNQLLWTFFTSLTLALLTSYQAITFCFAFYRLIKAFIDQRRIETSSSDRNHLFKGIGWITGGLKLGAIETIIGFAQGSFGAALTRRMLRFLARAFICIGLVKGLDSVEDFRALHEEMQTNRKEEKMKTSANKQFRRSRIRPFISNPRVSTFRHLSPTATAFHSTPHAPRGFPGIQDSASVKGEKSSERVTVHFEEGNAPTLHLRFSSLDLPSPGLIVENIKSRPPSEWASTHRASSYSAAFSMDQNKIAVPPQAWTPMSTQPRIYSSFTNRSRALSSFSEKSIPDSIHAVRELAAQFPSLPPRIMDKGKQRMPVERPEPSLDNSSPGANSRSVRDSRSVLPDNPFGEGSTAVTVTVVEGEPAHVAKNTHDDHQWTVSETSSPTNTPTTGLSTFTRRTGSALTPDTDDPFLYEAALHSGKSRELGYKSSNTARTARWIGSSSRPSNDLPLDVVAEQYPQEHAPSHALSQPISERDTANELRDRVRSTDTLTIPWLKNPEMMEEDEVRLTEVLGRKSPPSRFKTVGKAPRKYTPTPIKTGYARGSIAIEPIMIPRQGEANMEVIQGSLTSTSSGGGVLRDSEVLGIEDGSYVVQAKSFFYHN